MEQEISYEQHVQQNNERLISIKNQLGDVRGYEKGCRELVAWCADPRAFHTPFEENLLSALGEVVNVSSRDGFDRELALSLITCCHMHRKLLSRAGSIKINRWYEQMKRQKRAQTGGVVRKTRSSNSPRKQNPPGYNDSFSGNLHIDTDPNTIINGAPRENTLSDDGKNSAVLMWSGPSGGTMAGASVGGTLAAPQMSPAFGPMSSDYAMASINGRNPAENMQMQQLGQSAMRYPQYMQGQMPSPSFVSPNGMQQSYPVDPAGARPGSYMGPQCAGTSSYVGAPGYQQVMFENGSYNRQHPQQMMMASSSNLQVSYRCQQQFVSQQQQQMRSYGQQQVMQMQQQAVNVPQQQIVDPTMYPTGIPSATQRTPGMSHPMMASSQVRGMMMPGYNVPGAISPSGEFMRARAPGPISPAYPNGTTSYSQPQGQSMLIRAGPPILYSQMQNDLTRQQVVAYPNPNAAFRDPVDPVARTTPPFEMSDSKMNTCAKMAICEEIILGQISLNHNSNTVENFFVILEDRMAQLRRGEIDVQLKANVINSAGDVSQQNVWPTESNQNRQCSVSVHLNNVKADIPDVERSLYLRSWCKQGGNTFSITATKCICSHSFTLQYIKWKPVQMIIQEICMQRPKDIGAAKAKVMRMIQMDGSQCRIPLKFYYTNGPQRIRIPVRTVNCRHVACFDLEAFLMRNLENDFFFCPFCKVRFVWSEIEIDHFIAQILSETAKLPTVNEVNVSGSNGCWEAVDPSMSTCVQQQRASTPYSKNPGSVPQCPAEIINNRPMKREADTLQPNIPGGSGPSLKRIKSETVQRPDVSEQVSFNPGSVPAPSTSWMSSPNGTLPSVSPTGPSVSPSTLQNNQQQFGTSSVPSKYSGPDTPVTPGSGHNPASVGPSVSPGGTQIQSVMHSQGSVEAVSVAGSAPYTPASVSSLNSGNHNGIPASSIANCNDISISSGAANTSISDITCSLNASALDDVLEDLLYTDAKTSSASEMEMYLGAKEVERSINDDQDWLDFAQVIAKEA